LSSMPPDALSDFSFSRRGQLIMSTVNPSSLSTPPALSPSSSILTNGSSSCFPQAPPSTDWLRKWILTAAKGRHTELMSLTRPVSGGLGFSVVGLSPTGSSSQGVFVKHIQPGGIAHRDGRLQERDQILVINGSPLEPGMSHQQALSLLQQPGHTVELVVARDPHSEGGPISTFEVLTLKQQQKIQVFAKISFVETSVQVTPITAGHFETTPLRLIRVRPPVCEELDADEHCRPGLHQDLEPDCVISVMTLFGSDTTDLSDELTCLSSRIALTLSEVPTTPGFMAFHQLLWSCCPAPTRLASTHFPKNMRCWRGFWMGCRLIISNGRGPAAHSPASGSMEKTSRERNTFFLLEGENRQLIYPVLQIHSNLHRGVAATR
ncbi:hypothetical protein XENORESO_004004, partial [Xenotaenia resolanae]